MKALRIAFMGTPPITLPVLEALIKSRHELVCVYTQPPRARGRGNKVQNSPVHDFALEHGIDVRTPASLKKDPAAVDEFLKTGLDAAIVAGYGMMLPDDVLNGPRFGCLNVHPSLLPRWRGTSPVQYAIWKGDAETGVSVMRLVQQMDAGPVFGQKRVPITTTTTAAQLDEILWPLGAQLIVDALDTLANGGTLDYKAQDEDAATYAKLLTREDGRVEWTKEAALIDRQIRALNPWPGVWTMAGEKRLKIIEAEAVSEKFTAPPGTVIDHSGHVVCGNDTGLRLHRVQPENAKPMDAVSAINGGHLKIDSKLG